MNVDEFLDSIDGLIESGDYRKAFLMYKDVLNSEKYSPDIKAEAANMMGVIINLYEPGLSESEDESGIEFITKALELDPNNISALWNVVNFYGDLPGQHNHFDIYQKSLKKLLFFYNDKLTEEEKSDLKKRLKSIEK